MPPPGDGTAVSPATEPHARLAPEAPFDDAPRVLRVEVVPSPGDTVDLSRLYFVRGHVGPAHLRQVENGEMSAALTERVLPAITFVRDGASVLAPLLALEPGATYGVLSGNPPLGFDLHVSKEDVAPLLERVWPPVGAAGAGPFAIFCGEAPLAVGPSSFELEPVSVPAALVPGAAARLGPACLRIDVSSAALPPTEEAPAEPGPSGDSGDGTSGDGTSGGGTSGEVASSEEALGALPPPFVSSLDGAQVRLVPSMISLAREVAPDPVAPLVCGPDEVPFGPGCARIEDDRLVVATPEAPLLWVVRTGSGDDTIHASAASKPWVISGLSPEESVTLEVAVVDLLGEVSTSTLTVHTAPPMAHVILSEVLVTPLVADPDQ